MHVERWFHMQLSVGIVTLISRRTWAADIQRQVYEKCLHSFATVVWRQHYPGCLNHVFTQHENNNKKSHFFTSSNTQVWCIRPKDKISGKQPARFMSCMFLTLPVLLISTLPYYDLAHNLLSCSETDLDCGWFNYWWFIAGSWHSHFVKKKVKWRSSQRLSGDFSSLTDYGI